MTHLFSKTNRDREAGTSAFLRFLVERTGRLVARLLLFRQEGGVRDAGTRL